MMIMLFSVSANAASIPVKKAGKSTTLNGTLVKVKYNGNTIAQCTSTGAPAIRMDSTVYIPLKTVFSDHSVHANYTYNSSTHKATLTYGARKLVFKTGSKTAIINGTTMHLTHAPMRVTFKKSGITDILVPAKQVAIYMGLKYSYDSGNHTVYLNYRRNIGKSATKVSSISKSQFIKKLGPLAREDYKRTGILASVTLAQAILESGWGQSYLSEKSNNLFGIKKGSTMWPGGGWDGSSSTSKGGSAYRKYSCAEDSITDHSAYLLNSKRGSSKRYAGITKTKSYRKQFQIIRNGGYCTSSSYVSQLCNIVKKYNLTKYDK